MLREIHQGKKTVSGNRFLIRTKLVDRAEAWRWSSLWRTEYGDAQQKALVSEWPTTRPGEWVTWVNAEEGAEALKHIRQSVVRSQPFGPTGWVGTMIDRFGLASTVHSDGKPKKMLLTVADSVCSPHFPTPRLAV